MFGPTLGICCTQRYIATSRLHLTAGLVPANLVSVFAEAEEAAAQEEAKAVGSLLAEAFAAAAATGAVIGGNVLALEYSYRKHGLMVFMCATMVS